MNAIVKLLSEKCVADVQQGAKLLRHFVKDHGSSARNELLQWGVVHSVMTLLTEVLHNSHPMHSVRIYIRCRSPAFLTGLKDHAVSKFFVQIIIFAPCRTNSMSSLLSSCNY